MSREESDREDLLREATALVERVELLPNSARPAEAVVVGFRANGAASFFFGSEPVFQFNTDGELRRAFCRGLLLKASGGRLVSLNRVRRTGETQLLATELSAEAQVEFIREISVRLAGLRRELDAGSYSIVGQIPADTDVVQRVKEWIDGHREFVIAMSPNVASRRPKRSL